MADNEFIQGGKNPHFAHGAGIAGFCHNLQNFPQEWAFGLFTREYDPVRLDAIAKQSDNIKQQAIAGIETVGSLLAIAAVSGELSKEETAGAGWLVKFLGEVAVSMDAFNASAAFDREHGSLLSGRGGGHG
jgi:hypothetical protein